MSAQDNLNELQFKAYRGLSRPLNSSKGLGMHWSADKYIAESIPDHQRSGDDRYYNPTHTTVIHASIPMSSVETNERTLRQNYVYSPEDLSKNKEKEIPVKQGAPVFVHAIDNLKRGATHDFFTGDRIENPKERVRTRRYNPPRKMTT